MFFRNCVNTAKRCVPFNGNRCLSSCIFRKALSLILAVLIYCLYCFNCIILRASAMLMHVLGIHRFQKIENKIIRVNLCNIFTKDVVFFISPQRHRGHGEEKMVVVIFEVIPSQQWAIIRYYIGV